MTESNTKRNPPWNRDEHIVALDFYLRFAPNLPDKNSSEVKELSEQLNALHSISENARYEKFRNPNGVYMKLMNLKRFDPSYSGVGLAHGNKDEEVVWQLYGERRKELSELAAVILSNTKELTKHPVSLPLPIDDEEEADESKIQKRLHLSRERNATLKRKKKESFFEQYSRIYCEACGFDFGRVYGERGKDFIECHHTKPVSELKANEKTKLSDLVLLCSNCHRIIHHRRPWLSVSELRELLQVNRRTI